MGRVDAFNCARFLTSGPCPRCKNIQAEIMLLYESVYDIEIIVPRHPIVNVGETLGPIYIIHKLSELLGYPHVTHNFNIRPIHDLDKKNEIWKDVCKYMDWVYIH